MMKPHLPCVTLLGIGTIGGCVIQMITEFVTLDELIIIDRVPNVALRVKELCESSVFCKDLQKVKLIPHCLEINASNYVAILTPFFEKSSAVIDLTTVVSTEHLATLADKHNCVYLNACVELFSKCCVSIQERHERMRQLKLTKTCLLEHGMNPGAVSHLTRIGMADAHLQAEDIDLVHITEFDTHVLQPGCKQPNAFYNTWSPFGLYEEAIEKAELAWPASLPVPTPEATRVGEQMLVFEEHSGYEVYMDSVTPVISDAGVHEGWKKYQGFVVTHGETETISRFLNNGVICAFVFRTPPDATESLLKWKKEEAPSYVMMEGRAIEKGGDTIGVLIRSTKKQKAWWIGSYCTSDIARREVSEIQNGATITVAAACLAGIVWASKNPNKGILFPDEIPNFREVWENSARFMGHVQSVEVPWELVANMEVVPKIGSPTLFDV